MDTIKSWDFSWSCAWVIWGWVKLAWSIFDTCLFLTINLILGVFFKREKNLVCGFLLFFGCEFFWKEKKNWIKKGGDFFLFAEFSFFCTSVGWFGPVFAPLLWPFYPCPWGFASRLWFLASHGIKGTICTLFGSWIFCCLRAEISVGRLHSFLRFLPSSS